MVLENICNDRSSYLLSKLRRKLRRFCSKIRWLIWKRPRPKVVIKRLGKLNSKLQCKGKPGTKKSTIHLNGQLGHFVPERPIRIATFNVAMFTLAPAVPKAEKPASINRGEDMFRSSLLNDFQAKSMNFHPKSILKQSPIHASLSSPEHVSKQNKLTRSKLKVSINLPDNEISLANTKLLSCVEDEQEESSNMTDRRVHRSGVPARSPVCFPSSMIISQSDEFLGSGRTILEVLKEVDADILALQDVKAEEGKGMRPLSDLASALGMKYVFAESWAPEYGNAVLSKWPIKRWKVQKIANDDDFRNLLKVTIELPWSGEFDFYCTQLDHLDENWRMKQMNSIIQSTDCPHILAGGLNALSVSDYSSERWTDIVKYYEKLGKPTPKVEVMKFLKGKGFTDAQDFAGECESVVILAKGQNVQGTCKYGTRVDYILASTDSPYKFVPGTYTVISSKGTSDHHIVKVDIKRVGKSAQESAIKRGRKLNQRIVRITNHSASRVIWRLRNFLSKV
ncbi:DNAse I-like superfamily protein [Fagus crenata]